MVYGDPQRTHMDRDWSRPQDEKTMGTQRFAPDAPRSPTLPRVVVGECRDCSGETRQAHRETTPLDGPAKPLRGQDCLIPHPLALLGNEVSGMVALERPTTPLDGPAKPLRGQDCLIPHPLALLGMPCDEVSGMVALSSTRDRDPWSTGHRISTVCSGMMCDTLFGELT